MRKLKNSKVLRHYAAVRLAGMLPVEQNEQLKKLFAQHAITPSRSNAGLLHSHLDAMSIADDTPPQAPSPQNAPWLAQRQLRIVNNLCAQLLWHYDHGIEMGLPPQLVMKELVPGYLRLLPQLESLLGVSNSHSTDDFITKAATEAICFGAFLLEEGMEKEPKLPFLIQDGSKELGSTLARVSDRLISFEPQYQAFIGAYASDKRSPIKSTFQHPQALFRSMCLSRVWLKEEHQIPYSFDLFFEPKPPTPNPARSLAACFAGPELTVHWKAVRYVRSIFEGCLMLGPGRIDRQRH